MENLSPEMNSDHRSETALPVKRKRNLPGMPDPDSEVIALSPETLMATNRFVCEVCYKGFQRDQNLQLHRRGHNLPWKLRQRSENEVIRKRVYVCPEISCVHHDPSRALGDLTGIKKHFCRKHGEKKYKCDRCSKAYAVQSDRKAHMKTCGTREYRCECGTLFSRRDSFITHRAFCGALAQESVRPQGRSGGNERFYPPPSFLPSAAAASSDPPPPPLTPSSGVLSPELSIQSSAEPRTEKETKTADIPPRPPLLAASPTSTIATASGSSTSSGHLPITTNRGFFSRMLHATTSSEPHQSSPSSPYSGLGHTINPTSLSLYTPSLFQSTSQSPRSQPVISATALLQKAAEMGSTSSTPFLHHLWAAPPPSAVDSVTSSHDQSRLRTTSNKSYNESLPKTGGTGFHSWGGSKILGCKTRELASPSTNVKQLDNNSMVSGLGLGLHSSELFGDKPTTLDFLGLGMGGSQPSSGGFTAFLSSIGGGLDMAAPPPYGGETWEEPSKRKPSLL